MTQAHVEELHRSAVVFDGLVVAKWDRDLFARMQAAGLTAANCTVCVWEGVKDTLSNIAAFTRWFEECSDLIVPCHSTGDIVAAKSSGRVGIILGWQNSSGIEDRIELLPIFRSLGVRFIQLTYNTQNYVGSGCWEANKGGLSSFGREFVDELNRLGIVVDLSHVGHKSAHEAISVSKKPCAYTHVCPAALFAHPRNKSDEQLRYIVEKGGFVGVAAYAPFMRSGGDSSMGDVIELFEHVINVCGEEHVGIGTDFTEGQDEKFFDWVRKDKGRGQRIVKQHGTVPVVRDFCSVADYPVLTAAMQRHRWSEQRIRRILGENWLRYLGQVW